MIHYSRTDIDQMDKIFRLNLINSCTGFKSANLLGTKSLNGVSNVAVFSSITHLGSSPPLIGFILRPTTVPRDTYRNIKDTGVFTANHIYSDIIEDAHHTSAKYPDEVSEFTKTGLEEEFLGDFPAPFVKGAKIRLGCRFLNEYEIKENNTLLLVSAIEHVFIADQDIQHEDGWLKLENANTVAINGLDGYATTSLLDRYAYARPKKA
jgi:flavin reductase (DIM6/NTAB) family NADH-FMN oxidoreductase RutF